MRQISEILKSNITVNAEIKNMPRRLRRKKTRFFIDNEYLENGYAAIFPHSVTLIYCALAKYANAEEQTCFPSAETIRKLVGCSRGTVFRGFRRLEDYNIIVLLRRGGGRLSNLYGMIASSAWIPIHTVVKKRPAEIAKETRVQYQGENASSITPRTRTRIRNSNNISHSDFQEKEEYEETTVISAIQKHRSSWKEEDIIRALMKACKDGVKSARIFTDNALVPYLEKAAADSSV